MHIKLVAFVFLIDNCLWSADLPLGRFVNNWQIWQDVDIHLFQHVQEVYVHIFKQVVFAFFNQIFINPIQMTVQFNVPNF